MPAVRVCACGAGLEVVGDELVCLGCKRRARVWRVLINGKAVAAGTQHVGPGGMDVVAFTSAFEDGVLGFQGGLPATIHYAIPSGWRRPRRGRARPGRV